MRTREIRPGFFKNEDLVGLPFETRLLFIGLWCLADRDGRLEDRPLRIKLEIFPGDNVDIESNLTLLAQRGFIRRYQLDGSRYIAIPKFSQHQRIHPKENPSVIPEPGISPADPGNPIPAGFSCSVPSVPSVPSVSSEISLTPSPQSSGNGSSRPRFDLEAIYAVYPRKRGKASGLKALESRVRDAETYRRVLRAAEMFAKECKRKGTESDYIPHFSTWIHQQRWEDYSDVNDADEKTRKGEPPKAPPPKAEVPIPTDDEETNASVSR